jgi:hypothetical protein
MKLTLQIAAGVFIGIVAVMALRSFIQSNRENRAREHREHAEHVMYSLTPDRLIGNCGHPLKDATGGPGNLFRFMYYKDRDGGLKLLTFSGSASTSWNLIAMYAVSDLEDRRGFVSSNGEQISAQESPGEQIFMLPCLDSGR